MKRLFVVDTSVFLTYAAYDKIYRLEAAVKLYNLTIFRNHSLTEELRKNIPKVLQINKLNYQEVIDDILEITTFVDTTPLFNLSPDPKDNFLFDLALQTNSEVIVTKEKALLNFEGSPIAIHDIKWFKETFPVPL